MDENVDNSSKFDFTEVEAKWQRLWDENKIFKVSSKTKKPKYYCLEMFPYPSSYGLHMGHALNYTIGDIYARFKRMNGFNVLYPMGYDAFGLPAENAAIKAGEHPRKYTNQSIHNFIIQQKKLGLSYDWDRIVKTCEPDYYKWNQYIFLKFYENGLVYRKKAAVNWCPDCNTVLANEQVHGGKCWRHAETDVIIKHLEQWFIKTTKYAEELLADIPKLIWPQRIKIMQENWIGKSFGTEISFKINDQDWPIFTTRPDTIYGVTFMVVSAQHPRLSELVTAEQKNEVDNFLKKLKSVSEKDAEDLEKEGAFTGSYAINPVTNQKIPVYTGNFVIADYGSGMVMAVPAHDQRDFEFAKKYDIDIKVVIEPDSYPLNVEKMIRAYVGEGKLINSEEFNGSRNTDAIDEVTKHLEKLGLGKKVVQYKLRDWLVSRQRYWGTPIPMIYCDKCGIVPAKEEELPIILPEKVEFGIGNPLLSSKEFTNVKCPQCGADAKRETDTMDTFFDSSWYFLRYCDNLNDQAIFDTKKAEYWMPVDQYIGGAEHACMHLIYARFFTKALRDMGYVKCDEPFAKLFNQGMLHGSDGNKMSKSLGNVVNPLDIISKYAADSLRFNLMSLASPDKDSVWSDRGIEASHRFLNKIPTFYSKVKLGETSVKIQSKLNRTIKEVTKDIEEFRYNFAIIKIRSLFESMEKEAVINKKDLGNFLKIIHPICPHMTEELWNDLGHKPFISQETWPDYDESKIDDKIEFLDEMITNTRSDIIKVLEFAKIEKPKNITLLISAEWKYEFLEVFKEKTKETREFKQIMDGVVKKDSLRPYMQEIQKMIPTLLNDPKKVPVIILDQKTELEGINASKDELEKFFSAEIKIILAEDSKENKAKQAMPGKPAIIIE